MNYSVVGYRKMIGLTQYQMAKKLNISEATYRNKEKGKIPFKDFEMVQFHDLLKETKPEVSISDIFFAK